MVSQSGEKAEDFSLNSGKKETPSEVELLQQVTADLKAQLRSLKEQLEREKKTSSDVKSLKTQQVCALTFKLANAVRQRERAEEELAKIRQEMEELKEVVKSQEEELKGKDMEKVECDREVEQGAQDESIEREIKELEVEDVEEVFEVKAVKSKESEELKSGELTSDIEYSAGEKDVQQQIHKTGELKEVIEMEDEETEELLIEMERGMLDKDEAQHPFSKEMADGNGIAFPSEDEGRSSSVTESPINENDSLYLERVQNECDKLLVENSLLENSLQEETLLSFVPTTEISPLSSPELSAHESWKGNSSIQDNREESFHINEFQNSSSEKCVSSLATSFETCEDYTDDKEESIPNFNTQGDIFSLDESYRRGSNVDYRTTNYTEKKDKISERGDPRLARKNRRVRSQNSDDHESSSPSPPTSPGLASSGYVSNGTDDKLANLRMRHGISENQSVAVHPGSYREAQEASPKRFLCERDDVTYESGRMQDKESFEDFITKDLATPVEKRSWSLKVNVPGADKDIRKSQEKQNDFSSQNMSEEVEDLKQKLTRALKEIEELRLENKEMKNEITKLSSTAEENVFLVKTAQFTDRLLREMREREAKVQLARTRSYVENYGLDTDFSYSGNVEESDQITTHRNVRRSEDFLNRSARNKGFLPLKTIGEKLKEITRSVENMAAMDPDLGGTLSATTKRDFLDYGMKLSPNLNNQFEEEEQLIIPSHSSERVAAESTSFRLETPKENSGSGYTSVEKLGEDGSHSPKDNEHQLTERDCAWKDRTFHLDSHAQELSGFEKCRNDDSRDYVQRYVVRSSDYIAKLRDLKPEELALFSKFR